MKELFENLNIGLLILSFAGVLIIAKFIFFPKKTKSKSLYKRTFKRITVVLGLIAITGSTISTFIQIGLMDEDIDPTSIDLIKHSGEDLENEFPLEPDTLEINTPFGW